MKICSTAEVVRREDIDDYGSSSKAVANEAVDPTGWILLITEVQELLGEVARRRVSHGASLDQRVGIIATARRNPILLERVERDHLRSDKRPRSWEDVCEFA